ncbi:hypothetical protein JTB14_035989 [Gonioctena quinquepunctata]|nr:hypothetical protein JTB14_035989 [Gonioctena quinquepunctata]
MVTCSKCNNNKNEDDLWNCDSCKRPLCSKCGGLTASEVKCLQLKKRVLLFFCDDCRNGLCQVPTLRTEIADLRRHLDDFIETNKNLKGMIQDRSTRPSNILIHNIEESSSRNFKERIEQDTLKCKQIFDALYINVLALSKYGDWAKLVIEADL